MTVASYEMGWLRSNASELGIFFTPIGAVQQVPAAVYRCIGTVELDLRIMCYRI